MKYHFKVMDGIVPGRDQAWQHRIEVERGLRLAADYIHERITAQENSGDFHLRQFVRLRGESNRQQVLAGGW